MNPSRRPAALAGRSPRVASLRRPAQAALAVALLMLGCGPIRVPPLPAQSELIPCTATDCLRLLSWNVHGLPFNRTAGDRLANIAGKIKEQQPDVVVLQEVWTACRAHELARALAPDYVAHERISLPLFRPHGGLLVFVRRGSAWRVEGETFVRYHASGPWYRVCEGDGLGGKGALLLHLRRGAERLGLVTTHLQSQYSEYGHSYECERRRQLNQLQCAIATEFGNSPVLIAGDFNTMPEEALYWSHIAVLGDDLTLPERARCGCGTFTDTDGTRQWIDYVLARNVPADPVADVDVRRLENQAVDDPYSDHDGLLVRVRFDGSRLR
jgi:endonuclease/exonuclease/phosphatase (EEP) superfamily protein YafD